MTPLLNNSFFQCGRYGQSRDDCRIVGGKTQVLMVTKDSLQSASSGNVYTFKGLIFENSQHWSIVAASSNPLSQAQFLDCHWKVRSNVILPSLNRSCLTPLLNNDYDIFSILIRVPRDMLPFLSLLDMLFPRLIWLLVLDIFWIVSTILLVVIIILEWKREDEHCNKMTISLCKVTVVLVWKFTLSTQHLRYVHRLS